MLKGIIGDLIHNSGKSNDVEFWADNSGLVTGSATDHMVNVLVGQGYSGTPKDMFRTWLRAMSGGYGTTVDNALGLFSTVTPTAPPFNFLEVNDDDTAVVYDDGDVLVEVI